MTLRPLALILLLAALLAAAALGCTTKVKMPSQPADGGTPQTPDSVQAIFDANCTRCHGGASPRAGMDLSAGHSYAALVNVLSFACDPLDRVKPFEPDNSCIVKRIEGTVAPQMPLNATPLTATAIATIRNWIAHGAPATLTGPL
jgi:mono/diheme cytochrome c family protein